MDPREYQIMYELEGSHWWFQSRSLMIEGLLARHVFPHCGGERPRLLDLGCGTGMFLKRREADCTAMGLDFSHQALALCGRRDLTRVARADATCLPVADASFDIVTAFDLMEHVHDDQALVNEAWRALRPGGWLVASVPAHPILWSGHDVSLHHHRRYRPVQFEALFDPRQWERVRATSGFCLIFPAALAVRLVHRLTAARRPPISDTRPTAPWLNQLLIAVHRAEAACLKHVDLPVGISLLTIRRKIAAAPAAGQVG